MCLKCLLVVSFIGQLLPKDTFISRWLRGIRKKGDSYQETSQNVTEINSLLVVSHERGSTQNWTIRHYVSSNWFNEWEQGVHGDHQSVSSFLGCVSIVLRATT